MNNGIQRFGGCLITLLLSVLAGCGGDSTSGGDTSHRNVNTEMSDLSSTECYTARDATLEQPLTVYVARLTELADAGRACAQYGLGTLYSTGYENIGKDQERSRHYLSKAAAQGHPGAMRLL